MRFDRLCLLRLSHSFALVAAVVLILMLAVLDRVLLAGGPSLVNLLSRVVGWLTLGSGCLSSVLQLSVLLSQVLKCWVWSTLGTGCVFISSVLCR